MEHTELVLQLNKELSLELAEKISSAELQQQLIAYVDQLIQNNFEYLVSLLYRIDVSEPKITMLLKEQPNEDAAKIIAALIVERQLQKIQTRKQYRQPDDGIDDAEKW